jgi:flagellar hook-basal body complex protein FliE
MNIQQVGSVASSLAATSAGSVAPVAGGAAGGGDFGSMLSNLLGSLSQTEQNTNTLLARAAAGDNVDIHDVTIAMQTESLAFDLATQVRNKAVEAYQEVFRTQV